MNTYALIKLVKALRPSGKLSPRQARLLAEAIPEEAYSYETGMGRALISGTTPLVVKELHEAWPQYPWRVIGDLSGCRSRWAISTIEPDPRETFDREKHKGCCG